MDQLDIFSLMYPKYQINKSIRLIELFAGIGSQAKALKRLGANFEHYKVVEFDKYAIASYNAVHGTNFATSDITKINAEDLEIVDTDKYCYIMTYSFPCQDLSLAGKGKGMKKGAKTRSGLLWEVERILDECNNLPQILLMENVPQVHSEQNMNDFIDWQNKLESLGYQNYWQDLNAKDYGIPQNRNRCFMVSILGDYCYTFPKPFELKLRLKHMLEDEDKEGFELSKKNETICLNPKGGRKGIPNIQPSLTDRIYSVYGLSVCVTTSIFYMPKYLVNGELHTLTPKECWRLMGFDDSDFEKASKVNSNAQLYKQAGNSIVVNVLECIFKELLED